MKILIIILSLFSVHSALAQFSVQKPQTIHICAEEAGWPPYSRPVFDESTKSFHVTGLNIDLISYIFKKHRIKFQVHVKPWQRCLKEGISGQMNIVLDAAINPQRKKDYIVTEPIYFMTPALFYHRDNKQRASAPFTFIKNAQVLCGQSGYTYVNFGLDIKRIQKLSNTLGRILDLVHIKRCEVGLTRLEVLKSELVNFKYSNNISYAPIKGLSKENFHWLINKSFPFSKQLKSLIDSEIKELVVSRKMNEFYRRYNLKN